MSWPSAGSTIGPSEVCPTIIDAYTSTMIWNDWPGRMLLGICPVQPQLMLLCDIENDGPPAPNWMLAERIAPLKRVIDPKMFRLRLRTEPRAGWPRFIPIPPSRDIGYAVSGEKSVDTASSAALK